MPYETWLEAKNKQQLVSLQKEESVKTVDNHENEAFEQWLRKKKSSSKLKPAEKEPRVKEMKKPRVPKQAVRNKLAQDEMAKKLKLKAQAVAQLGMDQMAVRL